MEKEKQLQQFNSNLDNKIEIVNITEAIFIVSSYRENLKKLICDNDEEVYLSPWEFP